VEMQERPVEKKGILANPAQWATPAICVVILLATLWLRREQPDVSESIDERIALAGTMVNQGLPAEAIVEYQAALDLARGDSARKANICYLIGRIYFETLKDYEKALGYFARAKHFNAGHPESARMEKWTVACLERLGRSHDARNRMTRATALRPSESSTSGPIVASINGQPITMSDLDAEIRRMSPAAQKQFADPKDKARFLEQYVARRLLVEAAGRADIPRDPKVLSELDRAREEILLAAYYEREIAGAVSVTPEEMNLYYDAHREEFRRPRRLDLSHIELATEAAATSVVAALDAGQAFDALARKVSINSETRDKGGRLGSWTEGASLPTLLGDEPELQKAIAALKQGQRTPPLKTKAGKYQIVRADEVTSPTVRAFDEVRDTIASRLRQEKMMKRQEEVLGRLRDAEKVVIYPDAIEGKKALK